MNDLIKLRQKLHAHPELSGKEDCTAQTITDFILKYKPNQFIKIAQTGVAFVFEGAESGKTTMLRADMDALPIQEENTIEYKSTAPGVAHLCGHDGHSTILAGVAHKLFLNRPQKGRVVLLFQPAEETGEGAKAVVEDPVFFDIEPDYVFGLHNIPGVELHKVLFKENSFAAASKGMTIKLFGKTSHAAEPEKGISPTNAISEIIKANEKLRQDQKKYFSDKILNTIINIQLGEIAFGTSPGYAEVRITLRAFNNSDLDTLTQLTEDFINEIAHSENLNTKISYSEIFPAVMNSIECNRLIKSSVMANDYDLEELNNPFNWSEDFGYYTKKYKGGFFGLGSGLNQPALHNPNYNFPDELIETGVNVFYEILKQINY